MNLNELAKKISVVEGGKHNLNIGEIKQVVRCLGLVLKTLSPGEALKVFLRIISTK